MKILAYAVVATAGLVAANVAAAETASPNDATANPTAAESGHAGETAENATTPEGTEQEDVALLLFRKHGRRTAARGQFGDDQCQFSFGLSSGESVRDTAETICLNFAPAEIRGVKLEDLNGNGIKDPEDTNPIPGVTINLYEDRNGDGVLQSADDTLVESVTTGSDGRFAFTDLKPGAYIVEEELGGGLRTNDNTRFAVRLQSNDVFADNEDTEFLNFRPAEIHGIKLLDMDGDGVVDPEDTTPIAGVTFNLYVDQNGDGRLQDSEANPIASAVTDNDGKWWFTDLDPGNYIVREER